MDESSTRYAKFYTNLGDVVHRQHSPTCPHTVLCGVFGGSLDNTADKLKNFTVQKSRDTPSPRLGYS